MSNQTIQPLRSNWKLDEDAGFIPDQIRERVRSEDNYTNCKGYPLTEFEDGVDVLCPRMERINN